MRIDFIDRNPVTLDGKFYYIKESRTRIDLELRPNFIFLMFSTLFTIAGGFVFISSLSKEAIEYGALLFLLAAPILSSTAHFSKQSHRKRFEKALGLTNQNLRKMK